MDTASSVGGFVGAQAPRLEAEYAARVAVKQKDVQELEGQLALQLIQSAALPEGQGGRLDVSV